MPQGNSLGVVTGLAFVAIFLVMLVTFGQVSKSVHGPFSPSVDAYELAGTARPVIPLESR